MSIDEVKRGSAEVLILALVEAGDLHGYEIQRQIEQRSGGTLTFTLAALYATLYRLEARGWIRGRWVERGGQRRRRCYRITDAGRRVLAAQRDEWTRFIVALGQVAGVRYA
jgi:PadR family transcriptional regulator, regulatory protein PadR